ncbi:uncharacterized protein CTRU02_202108 [Colletotrichum truncatum]|uniref:Uncharacterized protein n=15 Tax=Colletotrichum truncatum TaxID=5467 RepID=A0ACC3Z7A1_COLTU
MHSSGLLPAYNASCSALSCSTRFQTSLIPLSLFLKGFCPSSAIISSSTRLCSALSQSR